MESCLEDNCVIQCMVSNGPGGSKQTHGCPKVKARVGKRLPNTTLALPRPPCKIATPSKETRAPNGVGDAMLILLLGLPGGLALVLFHYVPVLGNVIAFQSDQPYLGITESDWVGFANFSFLIDGNPRFINALTNTLVLTLIQTVLVFPAPLFIALVLNRLAGERLKRLLQSILYLPHLLSWVVVVALFQQMLGNAGMLNTFLVQNELPTLHIIGAPELFRVLITSQTIWKDAGWGTIIFLAAISRIDQEQYGPPPSTAPTPGNGW